MDYKLRIHNLVQDSIVDGPGLRLTVFVQGCPHHCPGCHNPQTHDYTGGALVDVDSIFRKYAENPLLNGITFSGGEPFEQADALAILGKMVHSFGGNVITYTGYLYNDLVQRAIEEPAVALLLSETDVLIDGPYMENLRSLTLNFRGSSNQKVIYLTDRIPHII